MFKIFTALLILSSLFGTSLLASAESKDLYKVLKVVDGDTIKVEKIGTIRLLGMDTPETRDPRKPVQCFGKEASNKASELLLGQKVSLEFDDTQGSKDKFNRTLAFVKRADGLQFNLEMIKQGFAYQYTYSKAHKYQDVFKTAQAEAQNSKIGLWSPDTCNGKTTAVTPAKSSKTTKKAKETPKAKKAAPKTLPDPKATEAKPVAAVGVVKKSKNNICHDNSSRSYNQTKKFTAYNSLQECLGSGGVLPKN